MHNKWRLGGLMNLTDLRIYGAVLKLLKVGADVNINLISDVSGLSRATIYRKVGNYYLVENQIKRIQNGKQKKSKG